MDDLIIHFRKCHEDAIVPTIAYNGDVGYDLYAVNDTLLLERSWIRIHTGIKAYFPKGYYGKIESRSSLSSNYGLQVGAGVVDSGYTGELIVVLFNHSDIPYQIVKHERIAQLIIQPYVTPSVVLLDDNGNEIFINMTNTNQRNDKGFGSSNNQ